MEAGTGRRAATIAKNEMNTGELAAKIAKNVTKLIAEKIIKAMQSVFTNEQNDR